MVKDETYFFHQTPATLCKKLIDITPLQPNDRVLEPFRGEGAWYNNFPEFVNADWCEIEDGRDYRDYDKEYDWVISNPPFKLNIEDGKRENSFFKIIKYFSERAKKGMAFLGNDFCFSVLTPKRLQELNARGWYIHNIVVSCIKAWRGRYYYIIFKREPSNFYKYIDGVY
jgi:hypothetical protein